MENSVDALKIAFGVLVFVIALTVAFMVLSQAKQTSDTVFWASDKTNYYSYYNGEEREVGLDTVIATLYRYYNDSIRVTIKSSVGDVLEVFDTSLEKGSPWLADSEFCKKSIDYFISGFPESLTTPIKINETEVAFGGIRGEKNGAVYYIAKKSLIADYGITKDTKFIETFDEQYYSGSYRVEGDEKIKVTSGGTKLHITYTIIGS